MVTIMVIAAGLATIAMCLFAFLWLHVVYHWAVLVDKGTLRMHMCDLWASNDLLTTATLPPSVQQPMPVGIRRNMYADLSCRFL